MCVYVCMASRIYSVCIYSVRVYLLCMRVSTPSTQNPDERARSDRAHATTIQGQLRFDHNLQGLQSMSVCVCMCVWLAVSTPCVSTPSVCIYCVCVYLLHLLKTLTNDHNLQGYKQDDHPGSTQV